MLAITHTFIHGEDALKVLTVLEQPALSVELNATLELAADFAKASKAPATQAACGCAAPQRRSTSRPTIDAVVRLGAGRGSEALDEPTSARRLVANDETHSSTFWERKWDSIEN